MRKLLSILLLGTTVGCGSLGRKDIPRLYQQRNTIDNKIVQLEKRFNLPSRHPERREREKEDFERKQVEAKEQHILAQRNIEEKQEAWRGWWDSLDKNQRLTFVLEQEKAKRQAAEHKHQRQLLAFFLTHGDERILRHFFCPFCSSPLFFHLRTDVHWAEPHYPLSLSPLFPYQFFLINPTSSLKNIRNSDIIYL